MLLSKTIDNYGFKVNIKSIAYCLLLFFTVNVYSQNTCRLRLSGIILSKTDSLPLPYAEVFIEIGHLKTISNFKGQFEIKNLCHSLVELELDLEYFKHTHFNIKINSDTAIVIYLEPTLQRIANIQINQKKFDPLQIKEDEIALKESGKNLADQLELIPGIRSIRSGNTISKPMSQGLTGMRLPIFVNGIKQNGQQWGSDHGPETNGTAFDALELVTGAAVLTRCADAAGGYIELRNEKIGHPGETDISSGTGYQTNGNQLNIFSKYLHKPASNSHTYFSNLSFRKAGNYQTPGYILPNTGLVETMFSGGMRKTSNKTQIFIDGTFYCQEGGIYTGSHIGNVQDLLDRIKSTVPISGNFSYSIKAPKQTVLHSQFRTKKIQLKTNGQNYFVGAIQYDERKEFDLHRVRTINFPQLNISLLSANCQVGKQIKIKPNLNIEMGLQGTGYLNRYGGYYFIPDFQAINQAAFFLLERKAAHFKHTVTVRSEIYAFSANANSGVKQIHTKKTNAGTAMAWTGEIYKRKSIWKFDLGRLFRFPWFNELYSYGVHHGAAAFEQGNANLKKEITYKAATTFNYYSQKSNIYLQIYSNYIQNFINLTPDSMPILTVRGAFPSYQYQQFNSLFTGAELNWLLQINSHFEMKFSQSFLYAKNIENHRYPAFLPPIKSEIGLTYRNAILGLNLQTEHVFRQKFYTSGTDYIPPPAGYTLFNGSATFVGLFKKQNYQFIIGVDNILNKEYRNYLDRFRYFINMPGRNIYFRLIWNFHHHNEQNIKQIYHDKK